MGDNKIMNHLDRYRSDVREFKSATSQLKSKSKRLFDSLESLNATWIGPAHNVYVANVAEDKELMESVFKALRELGEELSDADSTYRKCEDRVRQEINSLIV